MDDQGHGTSCAGIIAQATTDNVKIQGFKAGSADGHVYTSSLICTYEYILNMNEKPDVINMSFGGYGKPLPTETQLLEKLKKSGIALMQVQEMKILILQTAHLQMMKMFLLFLPLTQMG